MSTREKLSFKILENHPADSRVKIQENNVFQTLSSRMGTGGGTYQWFCITIKRIITWKHKIAR